MLDLATLLTALAAVGGLVRLITARRDADRVIAIDVLTFQLLGLSLLLAFHDESPLAFQFAFALSLLGFLSTLILGRLIPRPNDDR